MRWGGGDVCQPAGQEAKNLEKSEHQMSIMISVACGNIPTLGLGKIRCKKKKRWLIRSSPGALQTWEQKLAALALKIAKQVSPNHHNVIKMDSKLDPKSMINRGCVADAFLEGLCVRKGQPHKPCDGRCWQNKTKNGIKKRCRKCIEHLCQKAR